MFLSPHSPNGPHANPRPTPPGPSGPPGGWYPLGASPGAGGQPPYVPPPQQQHAAPSYGAAPVQSGGWRQRGLSPAQEGGGLSQAEKLRRAQQQAFERQRQLAVPAHAVPAAPVPSHSPQPAAPAPLPQSTWVPPARDTGGYGRAPIAPSNYGSCGGYHSTPPPYGPAGGTGAGGYHATSREVSASPPGADAISNRIRRLEEGIHSQRVYQPDGARY
eukprot:Hpha_TRINITY_DN11905_c0_g1::TRINITY_DN11905_c0_g1_i1::g.20738::m.20738